jgi:hypothetical protein
MQEQIIQKALENLRMHTDIEGVFVPKPKGDLDGEIDLDFRTGKERFVVEVKREIRNHQLEQLKFWAKTNRQLMLVAETIFPKVKAALREEGIAYLDVAGNIFLRTGKHHLWIDGQKAKKTARASVNRAFTAAGLKLIYCLLIDPALANEPQRIMAAKTGLALGNINIIISGLKALKFLVPKNEDTLVLTNKKQLVEKWMIGYEEKLKPKLYMGNFRFLKQDEHSNWKKLPLKKQETFWGAEPAGALMTNYLLPGVFTLYTAETQSNLIKNYQLVPDPKGNIEVYKKYWQVGATFNDTIVHPLLAYADLMNTGDRRNIATAQKIYDELLYNRFQ